MIVDFHIHTNCSDGGSDVKTIFELAKEAQIEELSITDHNNIDAYKLLNKVDTYNIKVIMGVEIDVLYENKILHILLYGFDDSCKKLADYFKNVRETDIKEFKRMVNDFEVMNKMKIDKKVLDNFIEQNVYFDKVRLNNLLTHTGIAPSPRDAFYMYTSKIRDKERLVISTSEFKEISRSGVSVLAHPMKYVQNLNDGLKLIQKLFEQKVVDGLEVYNNRQTLEEQKAFLDLAQKYNMQIWGGSDFHGKFGTKENKNIGFVLNEPICKEKLKIKIKQDKF